MAIKKAFIRTEPIKTTVEQHINDDGASGGVDAPTINPPIFRIEQEKT